MSILKELNRNLRVHGSTNISLLTERRNQAYARRSNLPATIIATAINAIRITPYAAAVPRLKSRIAEAIAIETGRLVGVNTSTDATYSPSAITNASNVPASAPGAIKGSRTRQNLRHQLAPKTLAASSNARSSCSMLACTARTTRGMKRKK